MVNAALLSLPPITAQNWHDIIALAPRDDQKQFIASNLYSIAQSKVQPECMPLAIYAEATPIGFAMYALDQDDGHYWIYRMMIDAHYQGQGYGRAALQLLIEMMQLLPGCDRIHLGVNPENKTAMSLYTQAGFKPTGLILGEEVILAFYPPPPLSTQRE